MPHELGGVGIGTADWGTYRHTEVGGMAFGLTILCLVPLRVSVDKWRAVDDTICMLVLP